LTQQIESDVPHRHHIFGGMLLPDAAAVFIARDVQRPMERMLTIPMLANHRDEDRRRPYEARKVNAIVTGNGRARVGRTNRFDDKHRWEGRPLCQLRQGSQVCYGPDPAPHGAAVRVIEGSKEMLGVAPRQLVFDVLMQVLFDRSVGLLVITLQGQERVASLLPNLASNGRLAAHGIHGHNPAFDREHVQEFWNGRDLLGLFSRFGLAHDEAAMVRTPGGEHVQRGSSSGPIKRCLHRLAVERDEGPLGELRNRLGPGQEALLKALWIEAGKHPAKRIVRRHPMRQGEEGGQPGALALAKQLHILEPFPTRQQGTQGNDQASEQERLLRPLNARVFSGLEMLDD